MPKVLFDYEYTACFYTAGRAGGLFGEMDESWDRRTGQNMTKRVHHTTGQNMTKQDETSQTNNERILTACGENFTFLVFKVVCLCLCPQLFALNCLPVSTTVRLSQLTRPVFLKATLPW